ncbi:MAG: hypothetical protein ABI587_08435 [Gemmatimonadales bacterium]
MTVPAISRERLRGLRASGMQRLVPAAIFDILGPGALTCLQGLLTNDLAKPGDGALVYGALLTPKGMIVADGWAFRITAERLLFVTDPVGHDDIAEIFRRTMPPRLAKVTDQSAVWEALWLYGEPVAGQVEALGFSLPAREGGGCATHGVGDTEVVYGRPAKAAPFQSVILGPKAAVGSVHASLAAAGLASGATEDAQAVRILAGWPGLGTEILNRTLPQEVRFDENDGVSYTKGCYTGQETVARLHFRGHTNRELRGLVWEAPPVADEPAIVGAEGRDAGTVTSLLRIGGETIGLGLVRREIEPGTRVNAGGAPARVVALPFASTLTD